MQLRQRSQSENKKVLRHSNRNDIEVGGRVKYEKNNQFRPQNPRPFHRWQHLIIGADRLTTVLMALAAIFFAVDIVALASITKETYNEVEQIEVKNWISHPPARVLTGGVKDIETVIIPNKVLTESWNFTPDFGGLIITPLEDGEERHIIENDEDKAGHVYTSEDYDDDFGLSLEPWAMSYFTDDNEERFNPNCRRPSWYDHLKPNCNNLHEVNVGLGRYLASGYFRDAFSVLNNGAVLKVAKLDQPYNYEIMEMMRIDAVIMDLLKRTKYVVDIFGHCGASVLVDFIQGQNMDELFLKDERVGLEDLPTLLSPTEKLNMALEMAEALSELHGFEGGVIVHGDLQYCQYLLDEDNHITLSDFNRAEILSWDEENHQYCKYFAGGAAGNVRSPEEYAEKELDEKIDVYSFGNILYTLLTEKEPYEDVYYYDGDISSHSISGKTPQVDLSIRGNSFAEAVLASIMEKCFEYVAEKRVDIFWVVSSLRAAVQLNARLDGIKTSNVTNLIPHDHHDYYKYDQANITENESDYYYSYSEE